MERMSEVDKRRDTKLVIDDDWLGFGLGLLIMLAAELIPRILQ